VFLQEYRVKGWDKTSGIQNGAVYAYFKIF